MVSDFQICFRLLMLVSTLDGKVTAINMEDGTPAWSVNTGSGPLVSSSISKLEVKSGKCYIVYTVYQH